MTILPFPGSYEPSPVEENLRRALGDAYTVERELGGGGMSRVFVARDKALDRLVAIKVLAPELAATVSLDRFKREILLVAALQHPHIVGVLSTGEADGLPYFIMPFVEGESLRSRLARGALSVRESVRILKDVARALAFAHDRGVVHRDIKPDNVLLASGSATVSDFGVAKALTSARTDNGPRSHTLTGLGMSLGTPAYMALDQAAADRNVDHRADIYAFGVMAYEMLAGDLPFHGDTPQQLLAAQLTERAELAAGAPRGACCSSTASSRVASRRPPTTRPQSAGEIAAQLEDPELASGSHVLRGEPQRAARTRWRGVAVALVIAVVILVSFPRRADFSRNATIDPGSIAVMPLANVSPDAADSTLAVALTEQIRSALGRLTGVTIASSSATVAALSQGGSAETAGKQLRVAMTLEGAIEREGTRIRLSVRLVNSSTGLSIWSDVFERESASSFDLQGQITTALVTAVGEESRAMRDFRSRTLHDKTHGYSDSSFSPTPAVR